jgi:hypothetical protein
MLRRQGLITEWYDREIEAGSEWRGEIERELEAADVILLLVSADFLASDFCYEQEMVRAVERAHRGEALVIGVMLRPVDGWDSTPFAGFQLVPRGARPISKWSDADEAYSDVVERIRVVLEDRARSAATSAPGDVDLPDTREPAVETAPPVSRTLPLTLPPAFRHLLPDETDDSFLTPDQLAQLAKLADPKTPDSEVLSASELALLDRILDPELRRLQRLEMTTAKARFLHKMYWNLSEMRRKMSDAQGRTPKSRPDRFQTHPHSLPYSSCRRIQTWNASPSSRPLGARSRIGYLAHYIRSAPPAWTQMSGGRES